MQDFLNWFSQMWDKIAPFIDWDKYAKIITSIAGLIAILTFIFSLLSKSKNKKISKFSTRALKVLEAVKDGTEKAEQLVGASGDQKKEVAMNYVENILTKEKIDFSLDEISQAIEEDINHTKMINSNKQAANEAQETGRRGLEL